MIFANSDIHETATRQFTVNGKTYTMFRGTRSDWFGAVIQSGIDPAGILPGQIKGHADKVDAGTGEHRVTNWNFHK